MDRIVVADTGPLISLESIPGGFAVLRLMAERVLLPEAVVAEAGARLDDARAYLASHGLTDCAEVVGGIDIRPITMQPGSRPLHRGELEALALAQARNLPVLLEDGDARRLAARLGLRFTGAGGLMLAAARRGVLPRDDARRLLDALHAANRLPRRVHAALVAALDQPA